VAVAAVTAAGAIAAVGWTASWASAAGTLSAESHAAGDASHATAVTRSAAAGSQVQLTFKATGVKLSAPDGAFAPFSPAVQPTSVATPPAAIAPGSGVTKPAPAAKPKAVPKPAPAAKPKPAAPAGPYLVYDSVLPAAIPAGKYVATYSGLLSWL